MDTQLIETVDRLATKLPALNSVASWLLQKLTPKTSAAAQMFTETVTLCLTVPQCAFNALSHHELYYGTHDCYNNGVGISCAPYYNVHPTNTGCCGNT